ncbi:hypothetical protein MPH_12872 [Macrophomina phaseolina MS6]|uniref:Uncharacterized protein n=1 Tax=Macrophomina phaseolina (strain MS6) TaxID=1126212 RepID=K2S063_MACPH|nr:hypothetical protein MPH_12872 [Macrophomina phaseolina MS6]
MPDEKPSSQGGEAGRKTMNNIPPQQLLANLRSRVSEYNIDSADPALNRRKEFELKVRLLEMLTSGTKLVARGNQVVAEMKKTHDQMNNMGELRRRLSRLEARLVFGAMRMSMGAARNRCFSGWIGDYQVEGRRLAEESDRLFAEGQSISRLLVVQREEFRKMKTELESVKRR